MHSLVGWLAHCSLGKVNQTKGWHIFLVFENLPILSCERFTLHLILPCVGTHVFGQDAWPAHSHGKQDNDAQVKRKKEKHKLGKHLICSRVTKSGAPRPKLWIQFEKYTKLNSLFNLIEIWDTNQISITHIPSFGYKTLKLFPDFVWLPPPYFLLISPQKTNL